MAANSNRCSCAFCSGLAARPMLFADNGVGFAGADHGIFDLTATRRVDRFDALFGNNKQPLAGNTLRFIASDVSSWPAVNTDYGASPFTGPSVTTVDLMAGPQPVGRGRPGVDPVTGGIASNDASGIASNDASGIASTDASGIALSTSLDDDENETPWPAPVRNVDVSAAPAAAAGSSASGGTAQAAAVTPSLAPNTGQEQIIQWMTGLKADGTTTSSSFWSTSKTGVSWSWGTGSTVTFAFDAGSNWSMAEQNAWLQGFAVWSGEANIHFKLVSDINQAQVGLARYRPGAAVMGRSLNAGAYEQWLGGQYTDSTFTKVKATKALISLQVSTPASGFGDITSYSAYGGYGVSTLMHELGHLMGLGHAGNYNGSVSPASQQQNAYDVRAWTTMSYIRPEDTSAKYYSQYMPSGTAWGQTTDGYNRAPYAPMALDVASVQRLYGQSTETTFAGGQVFGFNTNITYTTIGGTKDTISQFDFTKDSKPVVTLYNYGLNNTLDLSGYSTSSMVDLRQGGFSSVAGLVNNIGIAFGTHIGIAIGGSGNDTFIVNDDGDIIDGGGGSDTVVFANSFASYVAFRTASGGSTVAGGGIAHTLRNVEYLKFADQTVAVGSLSLAGTQVLVAALDAVKAEGNSGTTGFTFTVSRSGVLTGATSVNWAVSGTAVTGADFTGGALPTGTVTFAAGENTKIITVNVAGDILIEADEAFTVSLTGATNGATIGAATANGTIQNDDVAAATLSLAATSASRAEGLAGAVTPFMFTVTRGGNTAIAASANWAVSSTAANAADFTGGVLPAGIVSFAAGETVKTITVNVAGDSVIEGDEAFTVTLSAPSANTTIATAAASGIILNDDAQVSIAAVNSAKAEGNSGATPFTFTVTRAGYAGAVQTIGWTVAGSGANAAGAADFTGGALPTGIISFAAGETAKVITVNVAGDTTVEADEAFTVSLSAPTNGLSIGTGAATSIITNDDSAPATLSIAATAASKAEGASGTTPFTFTVTRGGNVAVAAGATWTVAGSGSNAASAADFLGNVLPSGAVNFVAGETSKTVTVNVAGDTVVEADEAFAVTLSAPTGGATITVATATSTILNDDTQISIAANQISKAEGNSGTTLFGFTVTRTGFTAVVQSVTWTVGGTAVNAADFTGNKLPSGSVSFAIGETSKTISVGVAGDTTIEANEAFSVTLSSPTGNATLGTVVASSTILDDDARVIRLLFSSPTSLSDFLGIVQLPGLAAFLAQDATGFGSASADTVTARIGLAALTDPQTHLSGGVFG